MSDQSIHIFKPIKAKLRLEVDGNSYEFKKPSVGDIESLESKLATNSNYVQVYSEFFEQLGLKTEVVKSLDFDDLLAFVKFMVNPKKND